MENSRYAATAVRMDEALIRLLERKSLEYITVKEICAEAGVNRSTFYLHYETVGDLLAESIEYLNRKCFGGFDAPSPDIASAELDSLIFIKPDYLVPYLEFVRDNRVLFKTAVSHPEALGGKKTFEWLSGQVLEPILERFRVKDSERRYFIAFFVEGLIAVVMEWIRGDCADSVAAMCDVIMRLTPGLPREG